MKNIILCLFILLSGDVHAEGKWRERLFRFLPFIAPKTYKLEKLEQKKKAQMKQRVASMDDLSLMVLDWELKNDTHNINTIKEMAVLAKKEIYRRIDKDEQTKTLELLASSLKARLDNILSNEKTSPHFFEIFLDAARGDFPEKYKGILQEFLSTNTSDIMALGPTPEQFKNMIEAVQPIDASIKILQEALDRGKSANEFFAVFNAIAWPFDTNDWPAPSKEYRKALNKFFTDNAEKIEKLPLSAAQVKRIYRYVYHIPTSIVLLKGGLKHARRDADKFAAYFNALTPNSDLLFFQKYRDALNQFFTDNAEEIGKLNFSPKQVKHIGRFILRRESLILLLKGGLKHARGDADKFAAFFNAVTQFDNPSNDYLNKLSKFFVDNAEEIMDMGLSAEQIKKLNDYIGRIPTSIKILELALERAEYAGDFLNVFHIIAPDSPKSEFQHIYRNFLIDHAETIVDLDPYMEQMEKVNRYLPSSSTLFDMAKNRRRKKKKRKNEAVCATSAAALLSLGALSEKTGWSEI